VRFSKRGAVDIALSLLMSDDVQMRVYGLSVLSQISVLGTSVLSFFLSLSLCLSLSACSILFDTRFPSLFVFCLLF